jgi:hypothetical protein
MALEIRQGHRNASVFPLPGITAEKSAHTTDTPIGKEPDSRGTGAPDVVRRYGQFPEKHDGSTAPLQVETAQPPDQQQHKIPQAHTQNQENRDGGEERYQVIDQPVTEDDSVYTVQHRLGQSINDSPERAVDIPVGKVGDKPEYQNDDKKADDEGRRGPDSGQEHSQDYPHSDAPIESQGHKHIIHHGQDRQGKDRGKIQHTNPQGKPAEPTEVGIGDSAQEFHRPSVPGPAEPCQHDSDKNKEHIKARQRTQNVHEDSHKAILADISGYVEYEWIRKDQMSTG